jgi:pyrimidine operon attenuation protein/uracil phosphoribosyltransferase
MSDSQQVIMSSRELELALQRIALQILEHNQGSQRIAVVGIHTCGVYLADRIRSMIETQSDVLLDAGTLDITLYRDDWSLISQNPMVKTTDIGFDVEEVDMVLVDDVIYTGRTIRAAMDAIMDYGRPRTVQLAALVDRGGRQLPIQPDYVGMQTTVRDDEKIQVLLAENNGRDRVIIER